VAFDCLGKNHIITKKFRTFFEEFQKYYVNQKQRLSRSASSNSLIANTSNGGMQIVGDLKKLKSKKNYFNIDIRTQQ